MNYYRPQTDTSHACCAVAEKPSTPCGCDQPTMLPTPRGYGQPAVSSTPCGCDQPTMLPTPYGHNMPDDRTTREACLCNMSLAMSYVLMQSWAQTYEPTVALSRGTIFPELDLPFLAAGRACR